MSFGLGVGPSDFAGMAKYCLGLWERIRALDDEHVHFKAQAGMLSLVFGQLHRALLQFKDVPENTAEIFTSLRESCYLTLKQMVPTLAQFEKLNNGSRLRQKARRFKMAVQDSYEGLKRELDQQTKLLSTVVVILDQAASEVKREREHSQLMKEHRILQQKVHALHDKIDQALTLYQRGKISQFDPEVMQQASIAMQMHAPPELAEDIRATFRLGYMSPRKLMESPLIPLDAVTKAFSAPSSSDRQPGGYINVDHSMSQLSEKEEEDYSNAVSFPENNTATFDFYAGMSKGQRKRARRRERKLAEQNRWTAPSPSYSTITTPSLQKYVDGLGRVLEQGNKVKGTKLLTTVGVLALVGAAAWVGVQTMLG